MSGWKGIVYKSYLESLEVVMCLIEIKGFKSIEMFDWFLMVFCWMWVNNMKGKSDILIYCFFFEILVIIFSYLDIWDKGRVF